MEDFLAFRRMVTPVLIQIFFWLGILGTFFGGVALAVMTSQLTDNSFLRFILGLFVFILAFAGYSLFWRAICEVLILFFRMNETLSEMRRELRNIRKNQSETN